MKTKTIIALAVPAGIAKAFLTAKAFYVLGIIVAWLCAAAMAHAGEYTDGRAGMNRGDISHVGSDLRTLNDTMSRLSNDQQFLNGLLAYSQADTNKPIGGMLSALRTAAGNEAAVAGSPAGPTSDLVVGSVYSNGFAGQLGGGGNCYVASWF